MVSLSLLLAGIVGLALWTLRSGRDSERRLPLENLPAMFLLILILYAVLPPIFWLLQGGEYRSVLSGRLYGLQPTLGEQTYLTLLGLMLAIGVTAALWLLPRRYRSPNINDIKIVPQKIVVVCFAIVIAQFMLINLLQFAGIIRRSESYVDSYLVIQELPLLLRQVIKILGGLAFFSKLTILVYLFQRWQTHKKWVYLFLLFTILSLDPSAGRGGVFITVFASLILWNRFVKRLTFAQLVTIGSAGLIAFTALGIYRGIVGRGLGDFSFMDVGFGEFDMLWANAVELHREKLAGQRLPAKLFFSEFYAPIPSNFLPFEKVDYSTWYLDKYYIDYKLEGGGLMFGLLAQVAVGFGIIEALVRGVLIGLVFNWVTRYLGASTRWWHYPALLYCAVWMFQSVRDSSFALITPFIQVVLPAVVVIGVTASLLPRKRVVGVSVPAPAMSQ